MTDDLATVWLRGPARVFPSPRAALRWHYTTADRWASPQALDPERASGAAQGTTLLGASIYGVPCDPRHLWALVGSCLVDLPEPDDALAVLVVAAACRLDVAASWLLADLDRACLRSSVGLLGHPLSAEASLLGSMPLTAGRLLNARAGELFRVAGERLRRLGVLREAGGESGGAP